MFFAEWSRNSTKKRQQLTMEKVMTISQDVWRTLCIKDDDLKLTNTGGNKIKEPWCHPSSPWDAQEASSRVQSKKETTLIIDTKHGRLLWSRCLRQSKNNGTDHWSHATCWWINGDDLQAEDAQQDAPKTTRSRSSTSSDRFPHEVPIPTNQEWSQSKFPTRSYGQNIEGLWNFLDCTQR